MNARVPPSNVEAEQWVLGGLMLGTNDADEVFGLVASEDFYRHDHALIFTGLATLYANRKPLDFVSLLAHLSDAGTLENVGGLAYLGTLANDTASATSILNHARIIRELSQRRKLIRLASEISIAAYTAGAEDLAVKLTHGIAQITRNTALRSRRFVELYAEAESDIEEAIKRRRAGGVSGVPTSLPALDKRTGGWQRQRLYGIAARPGCGKTALLNQVAIHAAGRGHPGLICSLEMGGGELMLRALAAESGKNLTRIAFGIDPDAGEAVSALGNVADIPLWVDTETYSINGIVAQMAAHKHKHGIQWAAVDHIGLVETEKFNSRNDQIGHITRTLKQAAKRLDIAIIALSQLNRDSEKTGRRPGLHDLRDSGNIEQDLDAALFLHVGQDKRGSAIKPLELGLLKNRNGIVGWFDEQIQFDGATQRIREIAEVEDAKRHWQDVA